MFLTTENKKYLAMISAATGLDMDVIMNAALNEKRAKDEAVLAEIRKLQEKLWQPGLPTVIVDPGHLNVTVTAETPEQPKPRRKPGPKPKKTVNEVAEEIEQTEREGKMSREEFVEYFSKRGEA